MKARIYPVTDETTKWVLANLTPWQEELIMTYCDNNAKKIRQIGMPKWLNLGVPESDYDDLCDDAVKVLIETLADFDPKKAVKFEAYLRSNIYNSASEWYRNQYLRGCRSNLLKKNGKIVRDKKKNPIVIFSVSLDAPNEDGIDLKETVADPRAIEDMLTEDIEKDSPMDKYLRQLPVDQRKVAKMFAAGYTAKEIKDKLHMSSKALANIMQGLRKYENVEILYKK